MKRVEPLRHKRVTNAHKIPQRQSIAISDLIGFMDTKKPSLGRHRRTCSICRHMKCAEIEADFVTWRSPAAIAKEYELSDRSSIYRHAHALGLFAKRQRRRIDAPYPQQTEGLIRLIFH